MQTKGASKTYGAVGTPSILLLRMGSDIFNTVVLENSRSGVVLSKVRFSRIVNEGGVGGRSLGTVNSMKAVVEFRVEPNFTLG
jgi:hypothetical protein